MRRIVLQNGSAVRHSLNLRLATIIPITRPSRNIPAMLSNKLHLKVALKD